MTPGETGSCDQRPVARTVPAGSFRKTAEQRFPCYSLIRPGPKHAQFVGKPGRSQSCSKSKSGRPWHFPDFFPVSWEICERRKNNPRGALGVGVQRTYMGAQVASRSCEAHGREVPWTRLPRFVSRAREFRRGGTRARRSGTYIEDVKNLTRARDLTCGAMAKRALAVNKK